MPAADAAVVGVAPLAAVKAPGAVRPDGPVLATGAWLMTFKASVAGKLSGHHARTPVANTKISVARKMSSEMGSSQVSPGRGCRGPFT